MNDKDRNKLASLIERYCRGIASDRQELKTEAEVALSLIKSFCAKRGLDFEQELKSHGSNHVAEDSLTGQLFTIPANKSFRLESWQSFVSSVAELAIVKAIFNGAQCLIVDETDNGTFEVLYTLFLEKLSLFMNERNIEQEADKQAYVSGFASGLAMHVESIRKASESKDTSKDNSQAMVYIGDKLARIEKKLEKRGMKTQEKNVDTIGENFNGNTGESIHNKVKHYLAGQHDGMHNKTRLA